MKKKILVALTVIAATLGLTACGTSEAFDTNAVVGTLDGTTNVTLGEANFLLRYEQAQMEATYGGMLGENVYGQDLAGTGEIYGETAKISLVSKFESLLVLEAEAKEMGATLTEEEVAAIQTAAADFDAQNENSTKTAMSATPEVVERVLTLLKTNAKMYNVLVADVDTEVSDEEAAQKTISYIYAGTTGSEKDENGEIIPLTEEEIQEVYDNLETVLTDAKAGGDLADLAKEAGFTVTKASYQPGDETLAAELEAEAETLTDGEYGNIVEAEGVYYLVCMESTFDQEATNLKKESIVNTRTQELYNQKYEELAAKHEFVAVEDALDVLGFERTYTVKVAE